MSKYLCVAGSGAFVAALFCSTSALAQQTGALEEIVVTAQKRTENLQAVPISITAITAQAARSEGAKGTLELQNLVPGLVLTPDTGNPTIYLRGVGSDIYASGAESSIATYVDGVYMAMNQSALFSFNNIERVEVLKGPQGTLFGRNASGGLIHVITLDPSFHTTLDASAGYANYNTTELQFYGSAPLTDNAAANVAFYYSDQPSGWGKNIFDNSQAYTEKTWSVRAKQLVTIGNEGKLVLSEDYSTVDGNMSAYRAPLPGAFGVGHTPYPGNFYDANANNRNEQIVKGSGGSARFEHPLLGAELVNILAYRSDNVHSYFDIDSTPLPFIGAFQKLQDNYITEELQVHSPTGSKVKWIVGAFYLDKNDRLNPLSETGTSQAASGGSTNIYATQHTNSYAAFSQVTVPIGWSTNLTLGGRYTNDGRTFDAKTVDASNSQTLAVSHQNEWGAWTYRIGLDHQLTDDVMIYLTNSTGFKAGQYNASNPLNPPINPETINSVEGGIKSQWFDNRFRLNISAFEYQYKNLQVSERLPTGSSLVQNAAQAEIYGADIGMLAQLTRALNLHADISLLHGRFVSFPNAPTLIPNPAVCTPTPHTTGAPTGSNSSCTIDASGLTLPRSPAFTTSLGGSYTWDVADGQLTLTTAYAYRGSEYFNPDNRLKEPGYSLVNAELAYTLRSYTFRIWSRNLTDTQYHTLLLEAQGDYGIPGAPRTFGVSLEYKLGAT